LALHRTVFSSGPINGIDTNFVSEAGLAYNFDNSILYIVDYGNFKVYGCNPSSISGGYFSSCFEATDISASGNLPWAITLNEKNTFAYITDYVQSVYACPIANDGSFPFNTCTTISGFIQPVTTAILYQDSFLRLD